LQWIWPGLRFKIERTFKQALRLIGSFGYHPWMAQPEAPSSPKNPTSLSASQRTIQKHLLTTSIGLIELCIEGDMKKPPK
jgi:hypothetical protein